MTQWISAVPHSQQSQQHMPVSLLGCCAGQSKAVPAHQMTSCLAVQQACDSGVVVQGNQRRCLTNRAAAAAAVGHSGAQIAILKQAAVGARISVWWPLDEHWYRCTPGTTAGAWGRRGGQEAGGGWGGANSSGGVTWGGAVVMTGGDKVRRGGGVGTLETGRAELM